MIKHEDICGYPHDNMTHLGEMLKKKKDFPDEELVLFKSDISDAYHNLPMADQTSKHNPEASTC